MLRSRLGVHFHQTVRDQFPDHRDHGKPSFRDFEFELLVGIAWRFEHTFDEMPLVYPDNHDLRFDLTAANAIFPVVMTVGRRLHPDVVELIGIEADWDTWMGSPDYDEDPDW